MFLLVKFKVSFSFLFITNSLIVSVLTQYSIAKVNVKTNEQYLVKVQARLEHNNIFQFSGGGKIEK